MLRSLSYGVTAIMCIRLVFATLAPPRPTPGWATDAELVRVIDGDTADFRVTAIVRVRLADCWAPEKHDPGGPESTRNLQALLANDKVTLWIPTHEHVKDMWTFGRAVGWVWAGDSETSVNQLQVEQGHATESKP